MSDAHQLYIAKECTVCGVTLRGFVSASVSQQAQTVSPRGDGKLYRQKTHTVSIQETITVEAEDIGVCPALSAVGALQIKGARLAGGAEFGGTDLDISAASVHVDNVERGGLTAEGRPSLRLTLSVNSSTGLASGITYTVPA
jgi:hypothetical protein